MTDLSTTQDRSQTRNLTRVFLDPDGSGGDIYGVIVAKPTGIAYGTQCAGVLAVERYLEGYFVPTTGLLFEAEKGRIDVVPLRAVFHVGRTCLHGAGEFDLRDRVVELRSALSDVPFWHISEDGETHRVPLELDESRVFEAVEGWVPVVTPLGRGVFVWPNCD